MKAEGVDILQPDLSKCGGITEFLRVCALARIVPLEINPHRSVTGINMAATTHLIASTPHARYFEVDVASGNALKDILCSQPYEIDADGCVQASDRPGLGSTLMTSISSPTR